jgi:XTP/dITP diphosphohydrolase
MNTLVFATNNTNKVIEIRSLLPESFNIISLFEAGVFVDIPEPFDTLEENAIQKSKFIYKLTDLSCFADDTGLEVTALHGEPGVKSARYAGDDKSFDRNIDKLLRKLTRVDDRAARFRTVICLTVKGKHNIFEGSAKGTIIAERRGAHGFGYDPVFIPDGAEKTFAEMELWEKNRFSHRKKAFEKLILHLKTTSEINTCL